MGLSWLGHGKAVQAAVAVSAAASVVLGPGVKALPVAKTSRAVNLGQGMGGGVDGGMDKV